jgi:hypothetical protein
MRFPILSSPDQGRRMHENKGCSGVSIQYREASTIGRRQESPCHSAQLSLSVEFRVPIDCSMRSDWYFLHSLLTSAEPRSSAAAFSRTTVRREGQSRGISRSVARAGQAVSEADHSAQEPVVQQASFPGLHTKCYSCKAMESRPQ